MLLYLKTINNEALDLAVKTFVFPLRSFVIGNLLLFYFLYSFSNQLYLDSFVLNAIQLIAGLSMLFILLKPYTWILLELLSNKYEPLLLLKLILILTINLYFMWVDLQSKKDIIFY